MGEFTVTLVSAMVVASTFYQSVAFFTPYWGCSYPEGVPSNSTNATCQMRGLFFTCPDCYIDAKGRTYEDYFRRKDTDEIEAKHSHERWESLQITLVSAMVVASTLYQSVAFFTPYWGCSYPEGVQSDSSNGTCQMRGLFFTCPDLDDCYIDVPDYDVLGLAVASFVINIAAFLVIRRSGRTQLQEYGKLSWDEHQMLVTPFFMFGEFLAGIAAILIYIRYDEFGWSAAMFCTCGILVFCIVVAIVGMCCLAACGSDDD